MSENTFSCDVCGKERPEHPDHLESYDRWSNGILMGATPAVCAWCRGLDDLGHDYEPSDEVSPMQTDPRCRVCGESKRDHA